MMPPTRIEQLNNFQDAVQSPDGLNRLRALQAVEQALPSSQGLMGMPQVQAPMPMVPRQYGGEVGTGGLLEVLDDGTQVFDKTEEGILNRSLHGGMLQGQTQTASAPSSSSFSGGTDAPGTLASGTTAPSGFNILTEAGSPGQDKYGNTIGDFTGMQDYYDLNFAARDAGQDTFMYGDKLMQVDPGYLRGGGINPFISNRLPAGLQQELIDRPDLFKNSYNLNTITKIQGDPSDPSFYSEAPYLPTEDFSRDISGQYNSYYEANQAAKEAGSPTFMYGSKLAKTDPGLLPDYIGGPKPFISNAIPEKYISAGVNLPPGWRNMSANQLAKYQKQSYVGATGGMYSSKEHGGQIIKREGGGYVLNRQTGGPAIKMIDNENQIEVDNIKNIINKLREEGRYDEARELENNFNKKLEATFEKNLTLTLDPNQIKENRKYTHDEYGQPIINKEGGGQVNLSQAAEGLASFGRYGDNILVHMNPEELEGLSSLGKITYNPVTGLPEAFNLGKMLRKIAPIALAIAAPYAFGATTALGIGASTAFGSFAGNLIAGAKPKDALKAGLFSGLTAGVGSYLGGAASGIGGAAGQTGGIAGTTGAAGYGATTGAGFGGASTATSAGTSALKAGLGTPASMGAKGFGQTIGAGASAPSAASQFTTGLAGRAITPPSVRTPIQLAQAPVNVGNISPNIGSPVDMTARIAETAAQNVVPTQQAVNQFAAKPDLYSPEALSKMNAIDPPGKSISIFKPDGLTKENLNLMRGEIYDKYANPKGIAKLVGMDVMTPDYDIMYANEAREKEQQLRDAGYTVETDFNKQTVIRDSQGVIQPRNLTASMILDRALGRTPRTRLVNRYGYGAKDSKEGGLISLKHGGEFSGMVPGDGHGMEDNVYMPITEGKKQVGTLAVSPSEYVVDSYTMAALGNGNADAGAKVMDSVVKSVRKKAYGDTEQPNEISGLQALKPMMERV